MAAGGSGSWDTEALDRFVAWCRENQTDRLLIRQGDETIVEHYWNGFEPDTATDVFSVQKSVVSLVVGALSGRAVLDLDVPVSTWLGEGWTSTGADNEAKLTLRRIMTMTTGLHDDFSFHTEPGTHWYYNNNAYHQTRTIIERATGRAADEVYAEVLFDPLGMADTGWRERDDAADPTGRPLAGLFSTPRDLARYAALVLDSGGPVVDSAYVTEATTASQDLNPSYGLLWWLFDGPTAVTTDPRNATEGMAFGRKELPGPLAPSAPAGTVAGIGAFDQRLYLVPSLDLVVIRLGRSVDRATSAAGPTEELIWSRLAPALPC